MISSSFRIGLVAIALWAPVGAVLAQGQQVAAETRVARVPSWMWHTYRAYRKTPHYRALACVTLGRGGFCSWGHSFPTAAYAAERVVEHCDAEASRKYPTIGSCRLHFIGDVDVYGLKGAKLEAAIRVYQRNPDATKQDLGKPPAPAPTS